MEKKKTVVINLRIDPELKDRIQAIADQQRRSFANTSYILLSDATFWYEKQHKEQVKKDLDALVQDGMLYTDKK